MKIVATGTKDSVQASFIAGSIPRFSGTELMVPWGEKKPASLRKLRLFLRKIVALSKQNRIKRLSVKWTAIREIASPEMNDAELGALIGECFGMAAYDHVTYKQKPKDGFPSVDEVTLKGISAEAKKGIARGLVLAAEVNATRELSNMPGGDMTPKKLAEAAKKAAKGTKVKVKSLGRKEMQKLGMGAVLGIGKGSAHEPQFIVLEYFGGNKKEKPVVLAGKGVTFDTGGLQIKPGDHMYQMHLDMSGGAAVIHAVVLAAKLGIKVNLVGLVPAVENNPAGEAVRPGDILKSLSGKTIEILHTDAEGRVILADALTYAKRYNPACVVDVATLTGAALVALGKQCSGVMGNDEGFIELLRGLGEQSGDYLWPFPLWEEYDPMVKGTFGDVPNISTDGNSRDGGVIAGGKFLEVFAKELNCPWAHLDIAPRMVATSDEFLAKGAAGTPVRLLLALAEHYAKPR